MAGEYFNRTSLLLKLQFNQTTLRTYVNTILTADPLDEVRSGEDYGGVEQISATFTPPYPYVPVPEVAITGNEGFANATRTWILNLAKMYTTARTYTMTRKGDNISYTVKAVRNNTALISAPITWGELQSYITINIAPGTYIGDANFVFNSTWQNMILQFSNRNDGTFYYCHGSAPACHGSRGRR